MRRGYRQETVQPSLSQEKSAELLKIQIDQIDELLQKRHSDPEIRTWGNITEQIIVKAFGQPNDNLETLTK